MWRGYLRVFLTTILLAGLFLLFWFAPVTAMDMSPTSVNITITVRPLQAPTVTNGVGVTDVLNVSARFNGEITNTGNENPSVIVFYGNSDGGTNPASWTSNVSLGAKALGTFYYDATGLTPAALYYYRMFAQNSAGSDWAGISANFTTLSYVIEPPSDFTLTDLGAISVNAAWTVSTNVSYTMVRASRSDYPTIPTEGELVYYGDSTTVNSTGYSLDTNEYYFSAWGFDSDNVTYSSTYVTENIGGEAMTAIPEALNSISGVLDLFHSMMLLIPLICFSALAFWQRESQGAPLLFMATVAIALITGLNAPDIISGSGETSSLGITVGLMLIVYTLGCAGWAFKLMFWKGESE